MTREELKKLLPLMQEYARGKTIQIKFGDIWKDTEHPSFNLNHEEYRIKPESKYRPFKSQEECWNEMLKHQPFGWVINGGVHLQILSIYGNSFYTEDQDEIYYDSGLENFTFADGKPFGMEEE